MSVKSKRTPATRSSIYFCQEKYTCSGPRVQATFRCEECDGSYQCSACETQIHSYPKFKHHDRYRLEHAPDSHICQSSVCENKNYADLHCDTCKLSYCFECDQKQHRLGRRKDHKRYPHTDFLVAVAQATAKTEPVASEAVPQPAAPVCTADPEQSLGSITSIFHSFSPEEPRSFDVITDPERYPSIEYSLENSEQPQSFNTSGDFESMMSSKSSSKRKSASLQSNGPSLDTTAVNDLQNAVDDDITILKPVMKQTRPESNGATNSRQSLMKPESRSSLMKPNSQPSLMKPDIMLSANESLTDGMDPQSLSANSIMLINDREELQVKSADEFVSHLGIPDDTNVKIVSIFGNTGDGKSHTLNHTFFHGLETFTTSSCQDSCTVGVWAAYDASHDAIIIDTEGLLGVTKNQNQRTRLLLKILAISDVVIYRSRANKLHNDLFYFLHDASQAYMKHFTNELKATSKRLNMDVPLSNLGPAVIIFHETHDTETLDFPRDSSSRSANTTLQERFQALNCSWDAFCSLEYVGTRTRTPPTDFQVLLSAVQVQLLNTRVRAARKPQVVFQVLEALNEKFNGAIEKSMPSSFPDQYFTCTSKCASCDCRCTLTMNHCQDNIAHFTDRKCEYKHSLDNKVYVCKACDFKGKNSVVVPKASSSQDNLWMGLAKYAWSGYVLECNNCGIIYQSRKYWYGNREPEEDSVVRSEVRHVWPGDIAQLQGTQNAARKLLDGVAYIGESVSSVSSKPSKIMSSWMADQIAPAYWVPNHLLTHCHTCNAQFADTESKHHCRGCGRGFCDDCTQNRRPVPERGWGETPVRVCDRCYKKIEQDEDVTDPVTARRVGETLTGAVGVLASGIKYPLDLLKETARPTYWVSDHLIKDCYVCKSEFGPKLALHHCRACGQGVCSGCSATRRAVPARGWDEPVRVCDQCEKTGEGFQK